MKTKNKSFKGKKIRKDYQKKNLKNPFFRKNNKKEEKKSSKFLLSTFILLFIAFLFWLVFAAPFLNINNIEVNGLSRFDKTEIEEIINNQSNKRAFLVFKQKNIFLFKREVVSQEIRDKFTLADVQIEKKLFNKLIINISERPYAFIYKEGDANYFSSADNYLIESLSDEKLNEESKHYFILENNNDSTLIKDNLKLDLDSDYIDFVIRLKAELNKHPEINVDRFLISDQYFNSIFIKILDGPQIFINVNDSIEEQIGRLIVIKNNKLKDNFSKLDYIDLRYGDKVYFSPEDVIN